MPCYSEPGPETRDGFTLGQWVDAFCSVCNRLEELGEPIPIAARAVWYAHRNSDRERILRENAELERERVKKSALKKLTNAEKDVLGLRGE